MCVQSYIENKYSLFSKHEKVFNRDLLMFELDESERVIINIQREVFGKAVANFNFDDFLRCIEHYFSEMYRRR